MRTERTNFPASSACGPWETLLADALDGLLKPEDEAVFTAHLALCPVCAALYEEARKGREWLEFLSPEPEVPAGLLNKILAQTGPGQTAGQGLAVGGGYGLPMPQLPVSIPMLQRHGFMGSLRRFAEPRLLMTAAMAFFSIALTLNLTGVQLSNLRMASLRPSAVRSVMERRLTRVSTPIVRYYDHLRLVNEVEARVRELRRMTQGEGGYTPRKSKDAAPGETRKILRQNEGGTSDEPAQQSGTPAHNDSIEYLEASLTNQERPAPSGGSAMAVRERSTVWTA
jgi:hypothetical protein